MTGALARATIVAAGMLLIAQVTVAQRARSDAAERTITAVGTAAGVDGKAREEARNNALRKAVEQAVGVFLTAQTETDGYKAIYDQIFASAVGYVKSFREDRSWTENGSTFVEITAVVSTQQFEHDWATIAHTIAREGNPRVLVSIQESPNADDASAEPVYDGVSQSRIEEFLLDKGLQLMDRAQSARVTKRDLALANARDDVAAVAALGARFEADVVLVGSAEVRRAGSVTVGEATLYKYHVILNVRAIQTDSARLLCSRSFDQTVNLLDRTSGAPKALAKVAEEAAPEILKDVVEAWRQRAQVARTVELRISPLDFAKYRSLRDELTQLEGVQAVNLREITESVASIEVQWAHTAELLAEHLGELQSVDLEIIEVNANRLICKVLP